MHRGSALRRMLASMLLLLLPGSSAMAEWSFNLTAASSSMYYGYFSQMGNRGFFGTYDVDASATGNFGPLNSWVGNRTNDSGELTSGTDAVVSSFDLTVDPSLGAGWVKVKGRYIITAYDTATTQGKYVAISPAQLTMWSVSVDSPLFSVGYGKYDFDRGLRLQFGVDRTAEYVYFERSILVPDVLVQLVSWGWLPRRVLSWFNPEAWPIHNERDGDLPCVGACEPTTDIPDMMPDDMDELIKKVDKKLARVWPDRNTVAWDFCGPASLKIGFGLLPWQRIAANLFWNEHDVNATMSLNVLGYVSYVSKDLHIDLGMMRTNFHHGPELVRTAPAGQTIAQRRLSTPTRESYITEGWAFFNWSNRRFFLKAELDWYNRLDRFQRSADGTFEGLNANIAGGGGNRFASNYTESWRFGAEAGGWMGPISFRGIYTFLPGPDRRHGILIDRQPIVTGNDQKALGMLDPYSILMAYRFGGGIDADAYINDASIYGCKVDYALAANLVLEATALYATRNSHGYGWGYIRPDTNQNNFGTVDYGIRGSFLNPAPSIPEDDLGWEWTAGIIWKLLEDWTIAARCSYWKPGRWFNYACIDRSVGNWENPGPANNWGVNPHRDIDPVLGFEFTFAARH